MCDIQSFVAVLLLLAFAAIINIRIAFVCIMSEAMTSRLSIVVIRFGGCRI